MHRRENPILRVAAYAWASPNSLLGAVVGGAVLLCGGRVLLEHGALEFCGGFLGRALRRLPPGRRFCAITLGHVILGIDATTLALVRSHERVHVHQYERWGPLFIPAYVASSLWQVFKGRPAYLANRFECEAFEKAEGLGACGNRGVPGVR